MRLPCMTQSQDSVLCLSASRVNGPASRELVDIVALLLPLHLDPPHGNQGLLYFISDVPDPLLRAWERRLAH